MRSASVRYGSVCCSSRSHDHNYNNDLYFTNQDFDLLRLFEMNGFPTDPERVGGYLFLGDYVDRATQSIETIVLLLCFKLRFQKTFFLLRGNHECSTLNRIYGFFDECKRRYNVRLWRIFGDVFNCMPAAAIGAS